MIFARYLLKNYLKVLLLSIFSFIMILLVSRLESIANFAVQGANLFYLLLFTLYQIPYVLPIAVPISCLIAAIVVFQRFSQTHELTALRAGGIGLYRVISPVLCAALLISLMNFYITSELATYARMASKQMVYDLTSSNPLILLKSAKTAKLRNAYVQMKPVRNGEHIEDLLLAINNGHLNLCLAKKIQMENGNLFAEHVSFITTTDSKLENSHLMIENQQNITSSSTQLASFMQKQVRGIPNDYLKLNLLRIRAQVLKEKAHTQESASALHKCYSEMARRLSMGLAVLTFTLLGITFGIETRRQKSKKGLLFLILLTALSLVSFFLAKQFGHSLWLASVLLFVPHLLISGVSAWTLQRINRGIQ